MLKRASAYLEVSGDTGKTKFYNVGDSISTQFVASLGTNSQSGEVFAIQYYGLDESTVSITNEILPRDTTIVDNKSVTTTKARTDNFGRVVVTGRIINTEGAYVRATWTSEQLEVRVDFNIANVPDQQPSLEVFSDIGSDIFYSVGDVIEVSFFAKIDGLPEAGVLLNITYSTDTLSSVTISNNSRTDVLGQVTVSAVAAKAGNAYIRAEWVAKDLSAEVRVNLVQDLAEATENKIYWVDHIDGNIRRSNLDGSNVEVVLSNLSRPVGIALDTTQNGTVYWVDFGSDKIRRANLNGSAVEDLVTGLDNPLGIALDVSNGKMYWTEFGSDKICRANLNGTAVEDLVTGLDSPEGIELDFSNGKMYWTESGSDKICRANLNGTVVEDILTGLDDPVGIALDVSNDKMYWVEQGSDKIRRANLNGTAVEDLVTTGLDRPYEIALDLTHGKMYWTDWTTDRIQRANLDGSVVENVVTGLEHPLGLALDLSFSTQPNPIISLSPEQADLNDDGVVNIQDLTLAVANFGATGTNTADVNNDGVVDIVDLVLIAAAFDDPGAAPFMGSLHSETAPTREDVTALINAARQLNLADPAFQRGIAVLESLLKALTPKSTALLPNYPNPSNPETWIPYQLAKDSKVTITVYATDGTLVRTLSLGHKTSGLYRSKSRAAYWDGKNEFGERVASGFYFYTLTAGKFSATGKMLIRK